MGVKFWRCGLPSLPRGNHNRSGCCQIRPRVHEAHYHKYYIKSERYNKYYIKSDKYYIKSERYNKYYIKSERYNKHPGCDHYSAAAATRCNPYTRGHISGADGRGNRGGRSCCDISRHLSGHVSQWGEQRGQ